MINLTCPVETRAQKSFYSFQMSLMMYKFFVSPSYVKKDISFKNTHSFMRHVTRYAFQANDLTQGLFSRCLNRKSPGEQIDQLLNQDPAESQWRIKKVEEDAAILSLL